MEMVDMAERRGYLFEMMWPPRKTPDHLQFAAWILLAGLLFGQLGFGPGLVAAWTHRADSCTCPCEKLAEGSDKAHHEQGPCPDEGTPKQCPLGCDDCACCPGAVVAVAFGLPPHPEPPPSGAAKNALPGDPAIGVSGRIFRPPRASFL